MGCAPHAMPIQHSTPKRIRRFTACRSRTSRQGVSICSVPRSQGHRSLADAYVGQHSGRFARSWITVKDGLVHNAKAASESERKLGNLEGTIETN